MWEECRVFSLCSQSFPTGLSQPPELRSVTDNAPQIFRERPSGKTKHESFIGNCRAERMADAERMCGHKTESPVICRIPQHDHQRAAPPFTFLKPGPHQSAPDSFPVMLRQHTHRRKGKSRNGFFSFFLFTSGFRPLDYDGRKGNVSDDFPVQKCRKRKEQISPGPQIIDQNRLLRTTECPFMDAEDPLAVARAFRADGYAKLRRRHCSRSGQTAAGAPPPPHAAPPPPPNLPAA